MNNMKRMTIAVAVLVAAVGPVLAATLETAGTQETKPTGLTRLVEIINTNDVRLNADITSGTITPTLVSNDTLKVYAGILEVTGAVTIIEGALTDSKVVEADLKVVDSPSDEDFLTYESTTGDFEWHSVADKAGTIAAALTEGQLADSIVVSADIKAGTIADSDMSDTDAFTFGGAALTQTNGTFTGLESDSLLIGTTDDTFTFKRNDSGAVTVTAADDDANAALTVAAGGTGALTLGASGNTSITLTTDSTGNGELSLPADSIGDADIDWGTGAGQVSPADMTFAEGDITDSTVVSADIKDGEVASADIADGTIVVADVSAAGLSGSADVTVTAAAGSSAYFVGAVHRTVFTFTNVLETLADGGDNGQSQELMTFPEGRILVLSAAINATVTNGTTFEASDNDHYFVAIGTAAAGADATLSGTEEDIIPVQDNDTVGGTDISHEYEADMVAGADSVYDGTSSAVKLYFNTCVANTQISANTPVGVSGTLSVVWVFLGDD